MRTSRRGEIQSDQSALLLFMFSSSYSSGAQALVIGLHTTSGGAVSPAAASSHSPDPQDPHQFPSALLCSGVVPCSRGSFVGGLSRHSTRSTPPRCDRSRPTVTHAPPPPPASQPWRPFDGSRRCSSSPSSQSAHSYTRRTPPPRLAMIRRPVRLIAAAPAVWMRAAVRASTTAAAAAVSWSTPPPRLEHSMVQIRTTPVRPVRRVPSSIAPSPITPAVNRRRAPNVARIGMANRGICRVRIISTIHSS
jgi:hypothetical protein